MVCLLAKQEDMQITNIIGYLSTTFNDPVGLLRMMTTSNSILSGSRALEFFVPGYVSEDSDWDFFVPGIENGAHLHMAGFLSDLGVKWVRSHESSSESKYGNGQFFVLSGVMRIVGGSRENVRKVTVQLIWKSGMTAFECVLLFHSSIVQCVLTGFCAFCMYKEETLKRRSYHWSSNDRCVEESGSSRMVSKYVTRGTEYAPYPVSTKTRYVGDDNTLIVGFPVEVIGGSDLSLSLLLERLRYLKWVETNTENNCRTVRVVSSEEGERVI